MASDRQPLSQPSAAVVVCDRFGDGKWCWCWSDEYVGPKLGWPISPAEHHEVYSKGVRKSFI